VRRSQISTRHSQILHIDHQIAYSQLSHLQNLSRHFFRLDSQIGQLSLWVNSRFVGDCRRGSFLWRGRTNSPCFLTHFSIQSRRLCNTRYNFVWLTDFFWQTVQIPFFRFLEIFATQYVEFRHCLTREWCTSAPTISDFQIPHLKQTVVCESSHVKC
jgi:hypothetical protein